MSSRRIYSEDVCAARIEPGPQRILFLKLVSWGASLPKATGFEALIGWLYLKKIYSRIEELVRRGISVISGV